MNQNQINFTIKPLHIAIAAGVIIGVLFLGFGYQPLMKQRAIRAANNQINALDLGLQPTASELIDAGCGTESGMSLPFPGGGKSPSNCTVSAARYYVVSDTSDDQTGTEVANDITARFSRIGLVNDRDDTLQMSGRQAAFYRPDNASNSYIFVASVTLLKRSDSLDSTQLTIKPSQKLRQLQTNLRDDQILVAVTAEAQDYNSFYETFIYPLTNVHLTEPVQRDS